MTPTMSPNLSARIDFAQVFSLSVYDLDENLETTS